MAASSDHLRSLIAMAQLGDRQAFDRVVAEVQGRLRSAIRARIGAHLRLDPEDVFQDCLTRAFQSLQRFHWEGHGSFVRWLSAIAENLICSAADKQKRREVLELKRAASVPSEVSGARALQREERFSRLERALESLSPDHREVIKLARIEGLEVKEIAKRLGRSSSAVKNLLLRALKELKKSFGDTESFHLPKRPLGEK